ETLSAARAKKDIASEPANTRSKHIADSFVGLLVPSLRKVQDASERLEQTQRNLHVAFALGIFHRQEGRYPKTLDALTPRYLAEVPTDIFSGNALIYRPNDKGYLLYSVGVNGRDEGGRNTEDNPPGDDIGVRMPAAKP